jgi:hypothetical protein
MIVNGHSKSIAGVVRLFETKVQESNLQLITEYDDGIPIILGDSFDYIKFN